MIVNPTTPATGQTVQGQSTPPNLFDLLSGEQKEALVKAFDALILSIGNSAGDGQWAGYDWRKDDRN